MVIAKKVSSLLLRSLLRPLLKLLLRLVVLEAERLFSLVSYYTLGLFITLKG